MKVIIKPRGAGKTYDLVKRAIETGGTIICANQAARRKLLDMGVDKHSVVVYSENCKHLLAGRENRNIHIDDLEYILCGLFPGSNIKTIAINSPQKNSKK